MPVDAMMLLVSSSPPSFSCSTLPAYSHYSTFNQKRQSNLQIQMAPQHKAVHSNMNLTVGKPLRSCLRIQDVPSSSPALNKEVDNGINASKTIKKSVCFADSKGLSLALVKIMNEASDIPPILSSDVLRMITQDVVPHPSLSYKYVPSFDQPASNYIRFRERLEHQNVCLENIVVKDDLLVMGTLKVKNISFEKVVFIRTTFDQWKSFTDFPASFVQSFGSNLHKYDTFSFEFHMPTNRRIEQFEFSVCFRSDSTEFWDNNDNLNYRVQAEELREGAQSEARSFRNSYTSLNGNVDWSTFSYWKVGDDERPYW
ncbi:protein phosphatase 1 regulatory subunit 3B-like [Anneissia japonica]|uniref:protein phosphatase 1 regulatory subunit 3B-like n=1 Tax=Anneissia japonica TaxID=1529436 RepID=UPI00142578A8|nr:protein phosphatase 1 regulatory subunit 3B-like [Anneissia japonica]